MTDELGKYHHSGHFYKFGYLELMNEVDGHCNVFFGSTMLAKVRNYNRMYDSAAKILKKNHPDTKLIALCLGSRGTEQLWQTFLNQWDILLVHALNGTSYRKHTWDILRVCISYRKHT